MELFKEEEKMLHQKLRKLYERIHHIKANEENNQAEDYEIDWERLLQVMAENRLFF
jgi:CRISPR/Cas system CSM-associated protein Csm2 small subunit